MPTGFFRSRTQTRTNRKARREARTPRTSRGKNIAQHQSRAITQDQKQERGPGRKQEQPQLNSPGGSSTGEQELLLEPQGARTRHTAYQSAQKKKALGYSNKYNNKHNKNARSSSRSSRSNVDIKRAACSIPSAQTRVGGKQTTRTKYKTNQKHPPQVTSPHLTSPRGPDQH